MSEKRRDATSRTEAERIAATWLADPERRAACREAIKREVGPKTAALIDEGIVMATFIMHPSISRLGDTLPSAVAAKSEGGSPNCNRCGGLGYVTSTDGFGKPQQWACPCVSEIATPPSSIAAEKKDHVCPSCGYPHDPDERG